MNLTIIGTGYVGLVTATCLADSGNHVLAVDIDEQKVRTLSAGQSTIFEPGLQQLLESNVAAGRLRFTTSLAEGVEHANILFVAVGTPPQADGAADLTGIEGVIRGIAGAMRCGKVVVIKSTVPVGTGRRMAQLMLELTAHPSSLVSNPEFLREGAAVGDFLHPDRVVIGADEPEAVAAVADLYAPFAATPKTILTMSREAAEMVKYASNALLATRISFINEIADICGRTGVDIREVCAGMGADSRIGTTFLNPGIGYGGSCFPKDVQALASVAESVGADAGILRSVHLRNESQKRLLADMVIGRLGKDLIGKTLAIWGTAFKPNTDDIREAPAIRVIERLLGAGATVRCYDPQARRNTAALFAENPRVYFLDDPYEALADSDALLICTEWNEFRSPDFDRIRAGLRQRIVFDGRNLYDPAAMIRQRIEYHSIGRPVATPTAAPRGAARV